MSNRDTSSVQILSTKFEVDKASLDASKRAFRDLEGAGKQLVESNRVAVRVSDQYVRAQREAAVATTHSGAVYERVSKDIIRAANAEAGAQDRAADAYKRASRAKIPAAGGGTRGGADLGRIGVGVSSVAAVLPGGAGDAARGVADVIGVLDDLPRAASEAKSALAGMGVSVGQLAVAAPLAGVAIAALLIAFDQFSKQVQEAQKNLEAANQRQVEYYKLIATASAEQLDAEIKAKEIERDAYLKANQDLEAASVGVSKFSDAIIALTGVLGFGPVKIYKDNAAAAKAAELELENLRRARNSQEVQDRSAAEAAKRSAKETEQATRAATESTRAEERRTEAVEQATSAVDQQRAALTSLYQSINERSQQAAQVALVAEEDRLKSIADLNKSYAQRAQDQLRQQVREEARERRRADFDRIVALKQRELEEFDLLLEGDFAGVSASRRQAQVGGEIDRYRAEFEANEKIIAQNERNEDDRIQRSREVAAIESRASETRRAAAQTDLDFARQAVQTYFQAKGLIGNIAAASDALIMRLYQNISRVASVPQTNFGAPLGGGSRSVPTLPASGGAFAAGGAFSQSNSVTNNSYNPNFNISGANQQQVMRMIENYFAGITR